MTVNGSVTVTSPQAILTEDIFLHHTINPSTKLFLALYYTLILIMCWTGNSFTLYATVKHNAIKLDKLSVWIIQNLCVADILHGWIHVLPVVIALFFKYDLEPICKPLLTIKYVFIDANSFLINALVFNKLYRCRFPFRPASTANTRVGLTVCAGLSGCLYAVITIIKVIHTRHARFQENFFGCEADDPMPARYNKLDLVMTCIVLVIPVTTLVIANTALLIIALGKGMNLPETRERTSSLTDRRKSILNAQINKRSFIIIGATTIFYTVAQLPYLYFCFEMYGITNTLSGLTLVRFTRFSFVIMQSSCFVNPIIYFTTNRGFRRFMIECVYRCIGKHSEIERRSSIAALSRKETRMMNSVSEKSTRFSTVAPRLESKTSSVIFNVRAYYGCYNVNVPKCKGISLSARGCCLSEHKLNGNDVDGIKDDMNGNNGNLLETEMKEEFT
ncbi:uncharacterized protein LOC134817202 [Bolinopsis microptera]|uniref:uncharacterized protein LOC134817202 n=1 Tax=Bolinopsis microptera TaxID=2820187 RepID=UPI003079FC69